MTGGLGGPARSTQFFPRRFDTAGLLTDDALRAHRDDVFIDPASRGRGLARALVETILAHPALTTVGHWTLSTADTHTL